MSDITDAVTDRVTGGDFELAPEGRPRFTPNYTPTEGTRILRSRLYADEGGVATVNFAGVADEQALWIERGGSGRLSVYAEVTRTPDGQPPQQMTLRIGAVVLASILLWLR